MGCPSRVPPPGPRSSFLRYNGEGGTYYDRKIAEGRSSKETICALKRQISDRVYRHLVDDARRATT